MKALVAIALAHAAAPAAAGLSEADLAGVSAAAPAIGTRLPDLRLVDQDGHATSWADIARARPTVLLFADYRCRHLCGPGLTLTAGALHDAGLVAGRDYRLVAIGLDPHEGPADARAAALLTADAGTIAAATGTLGYRYARDAASGQYAHDAAVYVFGADGGFSTMLGETGTPAPLMRAAIEAAARDAAPQGFVARAVTLCFGLGATHGRYGAAIVAALRAGAIALILAAAALAYVARRRRAPC